MVQQFSNYAGIVKYTLRLTFDTFETLRTYTFVHNQVERILRMYSL
jgi:hypothetical protein